MIGKTLNKKKILISIFLLISCFFLGILFLYIERKILGISSTFHPDSIWYLNDDVLASYSYLSIKINFIDNIKNLFVNFYQGNLYYSVVNLFKEIKKYDIININNAYRNLILLNISLYAITNLLIFNYYLKYFHKRQENLFFLLSLIIFFILPYKLHLSVHILKESFIFFFLVIYILYQSKKVFLISLFFGTSFRFGFALYYLIFFNLKSFLKLNKILLFAVISSIIFLIYYYNFVENDNIFQSFLTLIKERNLNLMSGRDFDNIPNFSDNDLGFLYRSIIWPLFFLTGGFIFFTENIFFKLLGLEIIIMQIVTYFCHKKIIVNLGLITFLVILSLWVTTFTSFYRYAYLGFLALFLHTIFEIKIRKKI